MSFRDDINTRPGVFIQTYGCQMNKYDSELVNGFLAGHGYRIAASYEDADVVLVNTCGVREHAANRAVSEIDKLLAWKKNSSGKIVGMIGCLSKLIGSELAASKPDLDFTIGPDAYRTLPQLLEALKYNNHPPEKYLAESRDETYGDIIPFREKGVSAWIAVSRGCDNRCAYCMVPLARNRLRNRPVEEIISEAEGAVRDGYPEVVLLGQNVNAYTHDGTGFGGLLMRVAEVEGIARLRFMTSHPKDLDDEIIDALAHGGAICPELHLPVQSGSDKMLKAMNRRYTRSHYLELVDKIKSRVPGIALSTDIIVGFPGETDEDFRQTLSLVREVGYVSGFVYRYSPRPGTISEKWDDDVPIKTKTERLTILNEALEASRAKIHSSLIGMELTVLIEGIARKHPDQATGRSREGFVVSIPREGGTIGEEVAVRIESVAGFTLLGKPLFTKTNTAVAG